MKRKKRGGSLKTQILRLISITLIGVLITGVFSFGTIINSNRNSYDEWCLENLSMFETTFTQQYYKVLSLISAYEYNENIQKYLTQEESSYAVDTLSLTDLKRTMNKYAVSDEVLMDTYLLNDSGTLLSYVQYYNDDKFRQFTDICRNSPDETLISDIFLLGTDSCFAIARPIHKFERTGLGYFLTDELIGTSIFTVKTDFILKAMEPFLEKNCQVYLLNQDNTLMLAPENQRLINSKVAKSLGTLADSPSNITILNQNGYTLSTKTVTENGWKLVIVTPLRERLFGNTLAFSWLLIWPALLFCTFFIALSLIRNVNSFIHSLIAHMDKIGAGDLKAKLEPAETPEFLQITTGLNNMMDNINILMENNINLSTKLYREETQKAQAMLLALQSQMNPHFIYNTIECIKNIGICYDVKEIEQLSTALSVVLRYSLNKENIVTISREMECISNFITIQTIRFENKYEIIYDIDPNLMEYPILRLSLQPLVENAMKHGLEGKTGPCVLHIHIFADEQYLYMEVKDNGIGMEPEQVTALLHDQGSSGSVAISNLLHRLRIFYEDHAGLKIDSTPGEGTSMLIYIAKNSINFSKNSI